jgi:hypothetical protein
MLDAKVRKIARSFLLINLSGEIQHCPSVRLCRFIFLEISLRPRASVSKTKAATADAALGLANADRAGGLEHWRSGRGHAQWSKSGVFSLLPLDRAKSRVQISREYHARFEQVFSRAAAALGLPRLCALFKSDAAPRLKLIHCIYTSGAVESLIDRTACARRALAGSVRPG